MLLINAEEKDWRKEIHFCQFQHKKTPNFTTKGTPAKSVNRRVER